MKSQSHADCCFAVDPAEFRENVTITAFFFFFFLTILLLFSFSPEGRKALTSPSLSWVEDMLDVLLIFTSLLTSELMWIDLYSQSLLVKNTGPLCIMLHRMSGKRAPECDRALSSLSSPFSYCCSVERGGLPEVLRALIHTGTRCVRGPLIENLLDPPADPKRPIKQTAAETRPPQRCGVNTADTSTQPSVLDRLIY